eukprot:7618182-Alexandrium_andersonii.AAC.1
MPLLFGCWLKLPITANTTTATRLQRQYVLAVGLVADAVGGGDGTGHAGGDGDRVLAKGVATLMVTKEWHSTSLRTHPTPNAMDTDMHTHNTHTQHSTPHTQHKTPLVHHT